MFLPPPTVNSERPSGSSSHLTRLVIVIAFSAVNPANGKDALTTDLGESIAADSDGNGPGGRRCFKLRRNPLIPIPIHIPVLSTCSKAKQTASDAESTTVEKEGWAG